MSANNPLVSVIMPAYNAEKHLGEAIESIQNQTYHNWELLIINDGSTDSTGEIIEEYAKQDERINYIINQKNEGLITTRNKGLLEAKGQYIANLDSDDIAYPERLSIQVNYMNSNPNVVLLGSASEIIDSVGNHIRFDMHPSYRCNTLHCHLQHWQVAGHV